MASDYRVSWEIDAEDMASPRAAAWFARDAQLREGSIATVFTVTDTATGKVTEVDLSDTDG
jgi:hypothetical protein